MTSGPRFATVEVPNRSPGPEKLRGEHWFSYMDDADFMRIIDEVNQCSGASPTRPFVDVRTLPISRVCSDQLLREALMILESQNRIELKELEGNGLAVKLKGE